MSTPRLLITDGTTSVTLIGTGSGWRLTNWTPTYPQPKGGGVRRSSPMATGSEIVFQAYDNIVDTFTLSPSHGCQDDLIADCRALDQLLVKAMEYWTSDWTYEPVWLEARGPEETQTRYATIKNYGISELANPYAQPFFSAFGSATMDEVTIGIEHDLWQSVAPGTATEKNISATNKWDDGFYFPTLSADDADTDSGAGGSIILNGTTLTMGRDAAADSRNVGIRFRALAIPVGATIKDAWVEGVASSSLAVATCNINIYCESSATPAVFSTYANFTGRAVTGAVAWAAIPAWTIGERYRSPNIATIVQTVVSLAGWVSGTDLVVFFKDNASSNNSLRAWASWDHATYQEPVLFVAWEKDGEAGTTIGYASGTADSGIVANYQNKTMLTHLLSYDASAATYTSLLGQPLPYNLFPAVIANNDILYVGVSSLAANTGPFTNVVFTIDTGLTYTGAAYIECRYWNGAWVDLSEFDDWGNSGGGGVDVHFRTSLTATWPITNTINWAIPADWVVTTVNGISAYWIRFRVNFAGGADTITGNAQQNWRQPYTCTWASIHVAETETLGDIPMLMQLKAHQRSDKEGTSNYTGGSIGRIVVGLRSVERGEDFNAYVPLGDTHIPTGQTNIYYAGLTAAAADVLSIYGARACLYSVAGVSAMQDVVSTSWLYLPIAQQFAGGSYHIFLRYRRPAGSDNDLMARLRVASSRGTGMSTYSVPLKANNRVEVADFGRVTLTPWNTGILPANRGLVYVSLQMQNLIAGARTSYLYDLILIPADEWYAAFAMDGGSGDSLWHSTELNADSATSPKHRQLCVVQMAEDDIGAGNAGDIQYAWMRYSAGDNILQVNKSQRLWFFMRNYITYYPAAKPLLGDFVNSVSAQVNAVGRFLNMRGAS